MTTLLTFVAQLLLPVAAAPLLTGFVRKIKARLLGRRGPALLQPYRDLARLLRKEPILADNASWLFRGAPYGAFAAIWLAMTAIPTVATTTSPGLGLDLIAIAGLLGLARILIALAGMDVGTSFGGIGASREMTIGALAEPALFVAIIALAIIANSTALPDMSRAMSEGVGLRVSLALALGAIVMVAIAETGRIPVDNPATHLELTMVHEAMVLEYSGRHLAMIELGAMLKLVLYLSLIASIFAPWGLARGGGAGDLGAALGLWLAKLAAGGFVLAVFETAIAKMRVFRYPEFLGAALLFGILGVVFLYISQHLK
ncbi:respiratory chain complex I subunit 1 family protein [Vineibacter terrae]|uniref:respiratory chain complex I subunit 1 family protein n=1 Tax=Vineibacter terrae TaxID=2586908 RepID=UPI002E2FE682|nr:NADH-quinone oxidoreductase subunit H [Vineibacter terrae]HEX2889228.1 NADH-quinone oxidoreductase subunit H [Vineibacter terrae]